MKLIRAAFLILLCFCVQASFAQGETEDYADPDQPGKDTRLSFSAFELIIQNFAISFDPDYWDTTEYGIIDTGLGYIFSKKDTIHLDSEVFNSIDGKHVQLVPRNSTDKFKITYSVRQSITEQYDYRKFYRTNDGTLEHMQQAEENWWKTKEFYEESTPYESIKISSQNSFKIPELNWEQYEKELKDRLHLRDTFVDLSGESYNIATLIYKGKPALYLMGRLILRIERITADKKKEVRYIVIIPSYGC